MTEDHDIDDGAGGAGNLDDYKAKRDFARTGEPQGELRPSADGEPLRFVIQEHDATAMHWDLRLEHDGSLRSWAVPKGIPLDPKQNRFAVRTEDHPFEYLEFEGTIPKGEYGAGTMRIWDRGTFELEKWRDDEVMFVLHGERVSGRYVLFKLDKKGEPESNKNWMLHRMDPPADPTREPMPTAIESMQTVASEALPADDGWAFEPDWGGMRMLAFAEGGRIRLSDGAGADLTAGFPEFARLGRALGSLQVVLDGEIVALDSGRPSPARLAEREQLVRDGHKITQKTIDGSPVSYVIFDLVWLDGHPATPLPYSERRRLLEKLALDGAAWQTQRSYLQGGALLAGAREQGLDGVVAKRLDSPYEPGEATGAWLRIPA